MNVKKYKTNHSESAYIVNDNNETYFIYKNYSENSNVSWSVTPDFIDNWREILVTYNTKKDCVIWLERYLENK